MNQTKEQIRDEVAKEMGYQDFEDAFHAITVFNGRITREKFDAIIDEATERYAKQERPSEDNTLSVFQKWGNTHHIEPREGCEVELETLQKGQSVAFGDGKTFHWLLTEKNEQETCECCGRQDIIDRMYASKDGQYSCCSCQVDYLTELLEKKKSKSPPPEISAEEVLKKWGLINDDVLGFDDDTWRRMICATEEYHRLNSQGNKKQDNG